MPAEHRDTNDTRPESSPATPDRRALTSPANGRLAHGPGPTTPEGKAVSRFNAVKHGILSRHLLVKDGATPESRKQLRRLHAQLRAELAPAGIVEEMLVERILTAYWRLRRVLIAEQGLLYKHIASSIEKQGMLRALFGPRADPATPEQEATRRRLEEMEEEHALMAALLLKPEDVERITRYETTLERQLSRAIRDLRALQTQRLGHDPGPPATPLAIHVARVEVRPREGRPGAEQ